MKMKIFLEGMFTLMINTLCLIIAQDNTTEEAEMSMDKSFGSGPVINREIRSCQSCGLTNRFREIRTSIVGGEDVEPPFKYPWMVAIFTEGKKSCTGAIISEYFIMTAAHCLVKDGNKHPAFQPSTAKLEFFNPGDVSVAFLTSTYALTSGREVQEVIPHKMFNMSHYEHDIGLLKLKKKIICDKFKHPVCLLPEDISLPDDAVQTISGWGSTTGRVEDANWTLQQAKAKKEKFEKCRGPKNLEKMYYCLEGLKRESSTCYGDSGGPAFYEHEGKNYVIGVASFGQCLSHKPFFYTSVQAHMQWIYERMGSRQNISENWFTGNE